MFSGASGAESLSFEGLGFEDAFLVCFTWARSSTRLLVYKILSFLVSIIWFIFLLCSFFVFDVKLRRCLNQQSRYRMRQGCC